MSNKEWNDLRDLEDKSVAKSSSHRSGKNLLLIDGNNAAYRFLNRPNYNNYKDEYLRTVESLSKSYNADKTIVFFDFGKSYYRLGLYPEYKTRIVKSEEEQKKYDEFFEVLNGLVDELPCPSLRSRGVEADDLICYTIQKHKNDYDEVWICSSDKDNFQLLEENVMIFNLFKKEDITEDYVMEKFGLTPTQFLHARILQGDTSDTIKGLAGIGEKRSADLIVKYEDIDGLLAELPLKGKAQYIQNLNNGVEIIERNRRLMDLKSYNIEALTAGKDGLEEVTKQLNAVI